MKRLLIKLLIFFSPFLFLSLLVIIVDPYNLFHLSKLFSDDNKLRCINRSNESAPRGNILWKTIDFRKNPCSNIILGDSRMLEINPACLERKIGDKVYNLAVPGCNINTIIDLFRMAEKTTKLKKVFIQINFNTYNVLYNFDLFQPTEQILRNPFYYLLGWNYIEDSFAVIYYSFTKDEKFVDKSYRNKADCWLLAEKLIKREFSINNHIYPQQFYNGLLELSTFCKKKHIDLTFIIAPDYYETQKFVKIFHLENEYLRFKNDITGLSKTIDLDTGVPFSFNRKNYHDYYHIKPQMADTIISMLYQSR